MRGASALNEALQEVAGNPMKVFVVWEPILVTDLQPPTTAALARVSDVRAAQFWDKDRQVSKAIAGEITRRGQDAEQHRYRSKGGVLWDTIAIYPPGVKWAGSGPAPSYTGGPVVDVESEFRKALIIGKLSR
ncbi:MAG TPA: hypothetical protein VFD73_06255 [Gemmatimonadales bacterium]|nr:hypothetical protein [Gemmatimonadales bacterium]